jgi:hypothetical protein
MTRRQRWWIDASVVLGAFAIGMLVWDATDPSAWIVRGLASGLVTLAIFGVHWGRRRWAPPD